jgi:acyl-coenzyme A thioesterase PaaI-like protein
VTRTPDAFDFPWVRMINPQPDEVSDGKLVLGHEPETLHLNHNGDVNAGVLFSLAEMAGMGVVVTALGDAAAAAYVVIKRGAIDFEAPARGRLRAVATLSPLQCARVSASSRDGSAIEEIVSVLIENSSGRVVARSEITAVIRRRRRE